MKNKTTSKHQIISLFKFDISELFNKSQLRLSGKFVIISNNRNLIMVYGPLSEYGYHANLVNGFCDLKNIASGWETHPDVYEILDKNYIIKGGGWFEFEFKEKKLKIFGYSTAYGSFLKQDFLDIVADNELFSDFELVIP